MKKYILSSLFLLIIISLIVGCGTDYMLSSFYLRNKDLDWLVSPSEQASIDTKVQLTGDLTTQNTSPSVLATPANYIIVIYERRSKDVLDIIGLDGNSDSVDIYASISLDASSFNITEKVVGGKYSITSFDAHGSPIGFVDKDGNVVVLAVGGIGFGSGDASKLTPISVSISSNNGQAWTDWADIDTNTFDSLKKKGYNRYYTNPGNGKTLKNGTLACIIDYRNSSKGDKNTPEGFAIFYSTNNGKDWQVGATMNYSGYSHRFARIIAENSDGSLLIAAVKNVGNDGYTQNGDLAWYKLDSLNGTITPMTVTGLQQNNGGTISGDNCQFTYNNISKSGIILAHSFPNRKFTQPGGNIVTIPNSSALSISEDGGKSWTLITNIVGTGPQDKASFRQSLMVLKDGTIANAYEEGDGSEINSAQPFFIIYRRFSLEKISSGTYKYEGL